MITIDRYLRPKTLEEAYEAAQKKNSVVLGGMLWLRLGSRRVGTAIDLSDLGLDTIERDGDHLRIGAYTSLRTLETDAELNRLTCNAVRDALSPIVGVQFRNIATVGGSVFGRFGFSDVITLLTALGADVELYRSGTLPLTELCTMGRLSDILTHVLVPATPARAAYRAQRNAATDFPTLNTCAVLRTDDSGKRELTVTVGARPLRAVPYRFAVSEHTSADEVAEEITEKTVFATNCRASAEYRAHLCRVLVRRAVTEVLSDASSETEER